MAYLKEVAEVSTKFAYLRDAIFPPTPNQRISALSSKLSTTTALARCPYISLSPPPTALTSKEV